MNPFTALRWTGSIYFLPVIFAITCLIPAPYLQLSGYGPDDLESASLGLYLVCPLTAAFTALRFRGFVRLVNPMRSPRTGVRVVLGAWWPLVLGAPAVFCAAVFLTARAVPLDRSSWSIAAVGGMTVCACALSGLACAWSMPAVVAVPVVGAAWFWWVAYTPGEGGVVVQNMDPTFTGCCSMDMQPARIAVLAALVLAGTIVVGVCLLTLPHGWARRPKPVVGALLAGTVAVAVAGAAGIAGSGDAELTNASVEPRSDHLVCKRPTRPELCLWPELTGRFAEVSAVVDRLNRTVRAWGTEEVEAVTQADPRPETLLLSLDPRSTSDEARYSVSEGYLSLLTGCREGGFGDWWDERVAFLGIVLGRSPSSMRYEVRPDVLRAIERHVAQAREEAGAAGRWLVADLGGHRCGAGP